MPEQRIVAPYGSWHSPITADLIVAETVDLDHVFLDDDDTYWIESRPTEGGRSVLVRRTTDGDRHDVTAAPFNVRSRTHEYGGGAYAVRNGIVIFSHFTDNRLYLLEPAKGEAQPRPITPEADLRYADIVIDTPRNRLLCVREDHTVSGTEPAHNIVAVLLDGGGEQQVLVSGPDFVASPRLSPDGSHLAWLSWNHPNMPWDGTELWVADLDDAGAPGEVRLVAGGSSESVFQPEWSPEGTLHFVSDRTGWWNLYRAATDGEVEPLHPMEAEFGVPQWVFGLSTYGFADDDRIICAYNQRGIWQLASLASLDSANGRLYPIETPFTAMRQVRVGASNVVLVGGSPSEPWQVASIDLATGERETLRRSSEVTVDPSYISIPKPVEFPSGDDLTSHAFFYRPANKDFAAPEDERPPLMVQSHGGPTASSDATFDLQTQYWTSRGFAVLDVNYGGSTGYGRDYRERLKGRWGIVDVEDCANGARYLADSGEVDPERLIIRGWSASGYTTLAALTFRDIFKAGASYFGISDLEALTEETHKFESRYLDSLIGPYPERRGVYLDRSPVHYTELLSCPMILFQGLDDKVVPPDQAMLMYEAVKAKGLPVALVSFEGEGHGFRKAENIKWTYEAELYFYSKVFGFELPDPFEPVEIANL
jgi:dipeptidyl aminopeptidase/acylaminoacyl peptidase